jgi:acetoin:2,6-dichlorophenolindophenol oxidoreductase subunit alpha
MSTTSATQLKIFTSTSEAWLLERWKTMLRIRRAEETIAELSDSGEARCPCHLSIGQEAVPAGVCAALDPGDTIWGGHRSHGQYLAQGGSLEGLFAEVLGKTTGCSGGRGGSMHLMAPEQGIPGTVPIVAGTIPLAAGAALAYKLREERCVAVAFFGDGALEEGSVHETLNLAALYKLPMIFVCENNLYSSHLHWTERRVADNLHQAGMFHSVPGQRVDGNRVEEVYAAAREAVARARSGAGPSFLECRTFRWRGHVGADADQDVGVRRRGELAEWLAYDPIRRAQDRLTTSLEPYRADIDQEIDRALAAARSGPAPEAQCLWEHVCAS